MSTCGPGSSCGADLVSGPEAPASKSSEELKHDWQRQKDAVKKVMEDEDAWLHVAYIYIWARVKDMSFKIKEDGTIDRRDNIGRLVSKLNEATAGPPIEFVKDPSGSWVRKEVA